MGNLSTECRPRLLGPTPGRPEEAEGLGQVLAPQFGKMSISAPRPPNEDKRKRAVRHTKKRSHIFHRSKWRWRINLNTHTPQRNINNNKKPGPFDVSNDTHFLASPPLTKEKLGFSWSRRTRRNLRPCTRHPRGTELGLRGWAPGLPHTGAWERPLCL